MWTCKHCDESFPFRSTSEKANHSRWCDKNPKRNNWNKFAASRIQFGDLKNYDVTCSECSIVFSVEEREKLHPQKEKYYCSRNCANAQGGRRRAELYYDDDSAHYTTVCWRHHDKICIVCGEEKIVSVHHINENHDDNDPKNLVPLCPTHHQYVHSRYRNEVQPMIDEYVSKKWVDTREE